MLDKELIVFMCLFLKVASKVFRSRWGHRFPCYPKVERSYELVISRNGVEQRSSFFLS